MAVIETQLEELKKDYDWIEAFGQGSGGTTRIDPLMLFRPIQKYRLTMLTSPESRK